MINKEYRVFGRLNALDFWFLVVILASLAGFALAREGLAGVNNQIKGQGTVYIDVYIAGLKTEDVDLFEIGKKSALTIRNQPVYPPLTVTAVKHWPKQAAFLSPDGKKAVAYPDPSQPFVNDFIVTVSDQAEITSDGYVVRGNKIKVGNLIELEGFKYRVQGVVIDIHSDK